MGLIPSSKSIRVFSLGCPKNLVDSEVMLGLLHQAGWSLSLGEEADVVLVNTCGFIREAKEESIAAILRAARDKESGQYKYLVVTGCLPQRYKKDLPQALPEVDLFLGTNEVGEAAGLLEKLVRGELKKKQIIGRPRFLYDHETPRILSSGPASAYIKIAEGCSNFCSYCVIPKIRGNLRSRLIPSVLAEVEKAAAQGVKEVNLIAQDITAFGQDARDGANLTALLRSLVQVEGIRWIRLLYAHPAHLTPELVSLIREEEKVCKYLDLPIQHIHDGILKAMNRRISGRSLREILAKIRSEVPGIALRTSLMVGFPGETKTAFQELFEFVKEFEFDHLGVFAYSPEEGTRAGKMKGRVPAKIQVETISSNHGLAEKGFPEKTKTADRFSSRSLDRRGGKESGRDLGGKNSATGPGNRRSDVPDKRGGDPRRNGRSRDHPRQRL